MLAAVFGQRDLAASLERSPVVDPRVFHDAEHPAAEIRAGLELREVGPGALDHRLHEIVGVVLIARQRAREAAQPRQQLDDAFTDFLRGVSHAFMSNNTSGEVIFFRARPSFHFFEPAGSFGIGAAASSPASIRFRCPSPGSAGSGAGRCGSLGQLSGARALRANGCSTSTAPELDRDPSGELVVRAEVVAIDVTDEALARALKNDFHVLRTRGARPISASRSHCCRLRPA
jgi:hypothetical protein